MIVSDALRLIVTRHTLALRNLYSGIETKGILKQYLYLDHYMLFAGKGEIERAVCRVDTRVLVIADIENCFVHFKVGRHKIARDFIFVGENEIVKS